jgi:hypothetical protein
VTGRWQGQVVHPFPGTPILYAFAVDGQEATSVNTGAGSSPIIGNITAYLFLVQPKVVQPKRTYLPLIRR